MALTRLVPSTRVTIKQLRKQLRFILAEIERISYRATPLPNEAAEGKVQEFSWKMTFLLVGSSIAVLPLQPKLPDKFWGPEDFSLAKIANCLNCSPLFASNPVSEVEVGTAISSLELLFSSLR